MNDNCPAYKQQISQQDRERTPTSVKRLVEQMGQRIEQLEKNYAELLITQQLSEKINRTSKNSSSPPSQDPPNICKQQRKRKSAKKRGGQKGHEGHSRHLYPIEQCSSVIDHHPKTCGGCGEQLSGEDVNPYRHQIVELPPISPIVVEHRLHQLGCHECGSTTRATLSVDANPSGYGAIVVATVAVLSGLYRHSQRMEGAIYFMNLDDKRNELSDEEKKDLEILKAELMASEGRKCLSQQKFAKLCNITPATAGRRLTTFQLHGFIDIKKAGKGAKASEIIWQGRIEVMPLEGTVPLHCPLYIQRQTDEDCKNFLMMGQYARQSVPFIRIKATKGMGKSSLLIQLHDFLEREQKQVVGFVDLDSDSFEPNVFTDLNKLYYKFTEEISQTFRDSVSTLNPPSLKSYWDLKEKENKASGKRCTDYLRDHIFSKINKPKTLLIDGIDKVIGQEKVQDEFLKSLRTWNERQMKLVSSKPIIWPSIVIAYSTDSYPTYGVTGSPLNNVGRVAELQEFSPNDILDLSKRYGFTWQLNEEVAFLMKLIGGHPTLINRALYEISQNNISLSDLEFKAIHQNGPFGDYLLRYLKLLQEKDSLADCFKKILKQEECINEFAIFQLDKAGLIKLDDSGVKVRCELYQTYFEKHL